MKEKEVSVDVPSDQGVLNSVKDIQNDKNNLVNIHTGRTMKESFKREVEEKLKDILPDLETNYINDDIFLIESEESDISVKVGIINVDEIVGVIKYILDAKKFRSTGDEYPDAYAKILNYHQDRIITGLKVVDNPYFEIQQIEIETHDTDNKGKLSNLETLMLYLIPFEDTNYAFFKKNKLIKRTENYLYNRTRKYLGNITRNRFYENMIGYTLYSYTLELMDQEDSTIKGSSTIYYASDKYVTDGMFREFSSRSLAGNIQTLQNTLGRIVINSKHRIDFDSLYEDHRLLTIESDDEDYDIVDDRVYKFDDVYGLENVKEELGFLGKALKYNYDPNTKTRLELPKGILLVGDPGVGKTYITNAFANEFDIQMYKLSSYTERNKEGVTGGSIRRCFTDAHRDSAYFPTMVFIDEIDKIITKNNDQVMATLLEYLSADTNMLVLAAANDIDILPEMLTRAGRFDRKIFIGDMSFDNKCKVFEQILDGKEVDRKDIDIPTIIKYLPSHITVATLDSIAKQIKLVEVVNGKSVNTVTVTDITELIIDGISEILMTNDDVTERTAYHEAGHALMGLIFGMDIIMASVVTSSIGLGFVRFRFDEGHNDTYKDLEHYIMMSLGGWAAENIIYGDYSTGAGADMFSMQSILNYLTTVSGASGINLISTNSWLGINDSTEEKKDLYQAKNKKTKKYINKTLKIIRKNLGALEGIKDLMIEHGKVSGAQIEEVFNRTVTKRYK